MPQFFVNRPIVAMVIAIITVIVGLVSMARLPIAQYPNIVPPQIQVNATYVGADALTVEQSVATPIEQQVNGVEGMEYMYSVNANNGNMTLNVFFGVDTAQTEGTHAGQAEQDGEDLVPLAYEAHGRTFGCLGCGGRPRTRAANHVTVGGHPFAKPPQWRLLLGHDPALCIWPDADEQIAVLGHHIDEHVHELGRGDDVLGALIAVGAEGVADAPRRLPLLVLHRVEDGVLGSAEVVPVRAGEGELLVLLRDVLPEQLNEVTRRAGQGIGDDVASPTGLDPAIVDDPVRHGVVVVREECGEIAARWPRDVIPQHIGAIAIDDVGDVS